jgi:hypothetical protein
LGLGVCLFFDSRIRGIGHFGDGLRGILLGATGASNLQQLIWINLGVCFVVLTQFRITVKPVRFWKISNPYFWLAAMLGIIMVRYVSGSCKGLYSVDVLLIVFWALMGQGVGLWLTWCSVRGGSVNAFRLILCSVVIELLVALSLEGGNGLFEYHGEPRWVGSWRNPNTFGLLMGLGVVLSAGMFSGVSFPKLQSGERQQWSTEHNSLVWRLLFGFAGILMMVGVIKSYCRGALVGVVFGVSYICLYVVRTVRFGRTPFFGMTRYFVCFSLCAGSLLLMGFWRFQYSEHVVVRRIVSVVNSDDFSWRNRLAAWEGGLQMIDDRLLLGFGWNDLAEIYESYYRNGGVIDGTAIETNDYLTCGTTLGMPALVCFCMYLWLLFTQKSDNCNWKLETAELEWLQVISRAGALVLVVGFWFDGGLFKVPTASMFWILLELGAVGSRPTAGVIKAPVGE